MSLAQIFISDSTGNWLQSSVSLALESSNGLVKCLRILTYFVLVLNDNFYVGHPNFLF